MATDVAVPALGESITEGTLAQWLKKPGEAVAADEPIATLETDKVSVDVPSPSAGVLSETLVKEGDTVAVGAVIARIDEKAATHDRPLEVPHRHERVPSLLPYRSGDTADGAVDRSRSINARVRENHRRSQQASAEHISTARRADLDPPVETATGVPAI